MIQYLCVRSLFKQLTLRSTFCKIRPVRKSKKPTRALSVSMQKSLKIVKPLANGKNHVSGICKIRLSNISSQQAKISYLK